MAVANKNASLGDVLLREGIITQTQFKTAQKSQRDTSHSMGRVLVDLGFITEAMRMAVLQKTFGFDVISLTNVKTDPVICGMIPPGFAIKHNILPIRQEPGNALVVAMEDPSDVIVLDAIKTQVGMNVRAYIGSTQELTEAVRLIYSGDSEVASVSTAPGVKRAASSRGHGRLYRIIKAVAFPILCFLPLVAFFTITATVDRVQQWLFNFGKFFDIGLYTVLLWALWSIVLFEVNGLIFDSAKQNEEEESA